MFWQVIGPGLRYSLYVPQPKALEDLFDYLFTLYKTKHNHIPLTLMIDKKGEFGTSPLQISR
jgi:hypothetical protein